MGAILSYSAAYIPLTAPKQESLSKQTMINLQKSKSPSSLSFNSYVLAQPIKHTSVNASPTRIMRFSIVLLAHLAFVYKVTQTQPAPEQVKTAAPISVSMIAPPAPEVKAEPEVVPLVEPLKVLKKPVVKPKKVVEKMVPVESFTQPVFEATTEPLEDKSESVEQVTAPVVVAKAAPKALQEEEKMELPKFGVAYLNNPAPEYPNMAKRAGEEGRVLLKVLVSAEGAAEAVSLEKSSGSERLDSAAKDAVSRWRFVPARKGGQALSAYVIVPIKFSLDD